MCAMLSVPVWGGPAERVQQNDSDSAIEFPVQVRRATLSRNDHNHADELEIVVDWRDAGVDPRLLSNAIVEFYLGCADDDNEWEPSLENRRFVGIATDIERASSESERQVTIKALDFTTLFIESKPFPPEGVPTYGMNLQEAWRMIVGHTGGKDVHGNWFKSAEMLLDGLVTDGVDSWPPDLSRAVSSRSIGDRVPVQQETDAWAVWQMCCGLLGLISWIDQDSVVVTTATNLYTRDDPPVMIWGKNISSMREKRNCALSGKRVCVMSYDPLGGRVLQSFYPSRDQKAKGKADKQSDYQVFEYNGVSDQATLDNIAQRVYEERVRQELEGTIATSEMWIESVSGETVDLLNLGSGQNIRIDLDQATMDGLEMLESIGERTSWLKARGYSDSVAELLARNAAALHKLSSVFYTKSVTTTVECDESGGSYDVEITYCNRIDITGDAF
jgi:hypothetical protein